MFRCVKIYLIRTCLKAAEKNRKKFHLFSFFRDHHEKKYLFAQSTRVLAHRRREVVSFYPVFPITTNIDNDDDQRKTRRLEKENARRKKLEWMSRYSLHRVQRRYLHLGMTAEHVSARGTRHTYIYIYIMNKYTKFLFSLFCRLRTMADVDNDS